MPSAKVIIDTGPAIGCPFHDVDDALAMLYLLALPGEFEVLGVTPVGGNAPLRKTVPKAREVLAIAGRKDIPVYPGAKRASEIGRPTEAGRFLAEAVRESPGEVTVLAIGPLTNIATAGLRDPDFFNHVGRIVVMGGALQAGYGVPLVSPLEFNFWKDTAAAAAVLAAECEKVIVTMDLCLQVVFSRRELDALHSMRPRPAYWLASKIEPWYRFNRAMPVPWKGGFVPWDVIAAVYLRRPDLFEVEETPLRLRPRRFTTGQVERCEDGSRPCLLPVKVRAAELLDEFLDAIDSGEWARPEAGG